VKNAVILLVTCVVLIGAMVAGLRGPSVKGAAQGEPPPATVKQDEARQKNPYIGKIQVLNGCGSIGAAKTVTDYLRAKKFDVKDVGNAKTGNYKETLVVSRIKDQTIAQQVAQALGIHAVILIRNGDEMYDVTVFVGEDFKERVR
jgi:hypothetical protein